MVLQSAVQDPAETFPELEKIQEHKADGQTIGAFLDWLRNEKGITLCERMCTNPKAHESFQDWLWLPWRRPINDILSMYFDIDQNKAEKERRQILESLR